MHDIACLCIAYPVYNLLRGRGHALRQAGEGRAESGMADCGDLLTMKWIEE